MVLAFCYDGICADDGESDGRKTERLETAVGWCGFAIVVKV
jgi:hypothetical protein